MKMRLQEYIERREEEFRRWALHGPISLDHTLTLIDIYYVAYKPITLPYILFLIIEIILIHWHSCVMFAMKSMSICSD